MFFLESFGHLPINVFAVLSSHLCIRRRGKGGLAKSSSSFCSRNILFLFLHPKKKKYIFVYFSVIFTASFLVIRLFPVVHMYSQLFCSLLLCVITLKCAFPFLMLLLQAFNSQVPATCAFMAPTDSSLGTGLNWIHFLSLLLRIYANENSINLLFFILQGL